MIYADYAADAPLSKGAREAISECMDLFGNPSSVHVAGTYAKTLIEDSRKSVAGLIGCDPDEVYFTSGGTEADNLALVGGYALMKNIGRDGIVTSAIEHAAVMKTALHLGSLGADVSFVNASERDSMGEMTGRVRADDFAVHMNDRTGLVGLMLVNNETGTTQPVREVAEIAHRAGALMFTDAVQAVGHMRVNVRELGVDMLSMSGHKFGSPGGIGALYIKRGVEIPPMIFGGGQERGIRSGTLPTMLIAALGAACRDAMEDISRETEVGVLRDKIGSELLNIPGAVRNASSEFALPGILNISFAGVGGEELVNLCSLRGVCISTGSACHSGEGEPSAVLISMGADRDRALSAVRISIGRETTEDDAAKIVLAVRESVELLRNS